MNRNNSPTRRKYDHFGGIHLVTVVDNDEELFKAYYDFAYYHVKNAMEMYENGASLFQLREQKVLFSQFACRKKEVLDRLKMKIYNPPMTFSSARKGGVTSFARYLLDIDLSPLMSIKEAFDFTYGKETKTLALYEKLDKTANFFSIKMLFTFLIASQLRHILYIDTQMAIFNGDIDRLIPAEVELEYAWG